MNKTYIGVDIGKQGAIAIIKENSEIVVTKMPLIKTELDYHELSQIINGATVHRGSIHVVFEKLGVIFGYFLRLDTGWQMNGFFKGKPIWYFAMGLDFVSLGG